MTTVMDKVLMHPNYFPKSIHLGYSILFIVHMGQNTHKNFDVHWLALVGFLCDQI